MNPLTDSPSEFMPDGLDAEMLQDLEKQSLDQIQKLRKHQRFELRVPVHLLPGNSSSTEELIIGTSVDFSSGGCMAHFPRPIGVGDVFRLSVEDKRLDVPMVFARCMRARLVREDVFEAGFSFFSSINIEVNNSSNEDDLLG